MNTTKPAQSHLNGSSWRQRAKTTAMTAGIQKKAMAMAAIAKTVISPPFGGSLLGGAIP